MVLVLDGGVGPHDGGTDARRADVDDEDAAPRRAHAQGAGPKGEGSPNLPGLRMPTGSNVSLRPRSTSKPEPRARGRKRERFEPDAVVMADRGAVGQGGVGDGVPGGAVVALAPLGVALGAAAAEGEVQAGAVGVGVGLVGRGGEGPVDGAERADHLVEEAGQRGPRPRDLGRVDDDAGAPQRGERGDVVAVAEPALDQGAIERVGAGRAAALVVDDGERAGEDVGVGLVEDDEHVGVGLLEVAARLGLVVEAQHGRRRAAAQDPAAGVEAGGEGREAEGAALLGRRERMEAEAGLGDDAERALAAHEELGQVGPGGGAGTVPLGAHDAAVGQHDLEPDRPCPRSSRSGSSTGPPPGRPASRRRSRGPSTGASGRACSRRRPARAPLRGRGRTCRPARRRSATSRRRVTRPVERRSCRGPRRRGPGSSRRRRRCGRPPRSPARPRSLQAASTAATCSVECRPHHRRRPLRDGALGGPADGEGPPVPAGLGPAVVVGATPSHRSRPGALEQAGRNVDDGGAEAVGDRRAGRRRSA